MLRLLIWTVRRSIEVKAKLTIVVVTAVVTTGLLFLGTSAYSWYMERHYGGGAKMDTEVILGKGVVVHYTITNERPESMDVVITQLKGSTAATGLTHESVITNRIMPGEAITIAYPLHNKN